MGKQQYDECQEMLDNIRDFKLKVEASQRELDDYVKSVVSNKEIALEARWKLFIKSDVGSTPTWIVNFNSINNFDGELEDRLHECYERRHEVHMCYFVDSLWEEVENDEDYTDEQKIKLMVEFKEEVMSKFIKSFIFDW